jgi:hypothetical protein
MIPETVVILLSDKRSGSTMIQRELSRHPDIRTVAYSPHAYLETHHWLKGAVLLGMPAEAFAGGKVYPGYGSRRNARTYLVDCLEKNVHGFPVPDEDRALVFDGWEALCGRFARPVFFEKSPQLLSNWAGLSLFLEWVRTTGFRVRVIFLTRNPMSVQYSAYNLFHSDPAARQFGWLETQRNMLAFRELLPEGTHLHIRYEDIVADPQAEFAGLCGFLGLPPAAGLGDAVHDRSKEAWKADPFFTLQLAGPVRQMAAHFGYAEAELENPLKPPVPPLRRIARRLGGSARLFRARLYDRLIRPIRMRLKDLG